jgi:hypothetical protein
VFGVQPVKTWNRLVARMKMEARREQRRRAQSKDAQKDPNDE